MTQDAVIAIIADHLDALGVPYMLVGSLASTRHGAPRMTHDADIVVDATAARLLALVGRLAGAFYMSEEATREAARRRGMVNAIHLETGLKVDLIVRKDRPFSVEELGRQPARGARLAVLRRGAHARHLPARPQAAECQLQRTASASRFQPVQGLAFPPGPPVTAQCERSTREPTVACRLTYRYRVIS